MCKELHIPSRGQAGARRKQQVQSSGNTRCKSPNPSTSRRGASLGMAAAICILGSLLGATFLAAQAASQTQFNTHSKLAPELEGLAAASARFGKQPSVRVIVQYRKRPTDAHFARVQNLGGTSSSPLGLDPVRRLHRPRRCARGNGQGSRRCLHQPGPPT